LYTYIPSIVPIRAAASTRVLEYYSSSKLLKELFITRVPVTFYFRWQISISGCSFFDELLEFTETRGFAISFATCQPGNGSEYLHVEEVLRSQCTAVRCHRCDL